MNKSGHPLSRLNPPVAAELLRFLRDQFSITTAEELVAATMTSGGRLRATMPVDDMTWNTVVRGAIGAVGPETMKSLQEPGRARFAKGARLESSVELPSDAKHYRS